MPEVMAGSRKTAARVHPWRDLLEQLQPLPAQAVLELCKARSVAARSRQTIDKASTDRVSDTYEYDWHGPRHLQQRPHARSADAQDHIRR